ncbi:MAG TPA: Rieske 2Fe-2S domain-containing protein [Gaiellaceae bacterium]|nr:Rieske 2Fe-2S domain-containing protein [Gaiellaceae bacterium]
MPGPELVTVARADEVPPGTAKKVQAGGETIALVNVDGSLYATQGACLHLQGPLGDGKVDGHLLRCPWHGWTYDVRTGKNDFDLAIELRTFEVTVEDGDVKVALG